MYWGTMRSLYFLLLNYKNATVFFICFETAYLKVVVAFGVNNFDVVNLVTFLFQTQQLQSHLVLFGAL